MSSFTLAQRRGGKRLSHAEERGGGSRKVLR